MCTFICVLCAQNHQGCTFLLLFGLQSGNSQPTIESAIAVTTSEELRDDEENVVYNSAAEVLLTGSNGLEL